MTARPELPFGGYKRLISESYWGVGLSKLDRSETTAFFFPRSLMLQLNANGNSDQSWPAIERGELDENKGAEVTD